jgi:hypothetical protein
MTAIIVLGLCFALSVGGWFDGLAKTDNVQVTIASLLTVFCAGGFVFTVTEAGHSPFWFLLPLFTGAGLYLYLGLHDTP